LKIISETILLILKIKPLPNCKSILIVKNKKSDIKIMPKAANCGPSGILKKMVYIKYRKREKLSNWKMLKKILNQLKSLSFFW
jgi:phosphoribosylaminoimidazole carboxylase (NCAIR synthetase)